MKKLILSIIVTLASLNISSQNWMPLNTGLAQPTVSFQPQMCAFTEYNSKLIVGGQFTSAGGNLTNHIAAWDGSSWSTLGSGVSTSTAAQEPIRALAVFSGSIIAAGILNVNTPMPNIVKWNGSSWSNLASTTPTVSFIGSSVNAFVVYNNKLIAAGSFTSIGGINANNIAQWDGTNWTPLGSGITPFAGPYNSPIMYGVKSLIVYNNELYAGGIFTNAGGISVSNVAKWNGTTWAAVGSGIPACTNTYNYYSGVSSFCIFNNQLYAGNCTNGVATWNGSSWLAVGGGVSSGTINATSVRGMTVYNGKLIAGGYFSSAGSTTAYNIAEWDGANWIYIGGNATNNGLDNSVNALTVYNNSLYAGGDVQNAHGASPVVPFNYVAMYTNTNCAITSSVVSYSNVTCFNGNNGSVTISANNGTAPYTYSWSPSGGNSSTANNIGGWVTYTCLITDANLCTKTQTVQVNQPTQLVSAIGAFTNTSCSQNNGSAVMLLNGGTTPYSYSWTPSAQTTSVMVNVGAGNYTCNVTDANGCLTSSSVTISQNTFSVSSSQNNVSCYGNNNGAAQVSASPSGNCYAYNWVPYGGTNSATGNILSAGNYSCIITNTCTNCSITQTFSITQPQSITSVGSSTNVSCFGGSNGAATCATPSTSAPFYLYSWSPSGGTGSTANNLIAGTYTCAVTIATLGCTETQTVTITQPTSITAIPSQTNVSCFGGLNGSASVLASGGAGNYTYSWSPSGGNSNTATNLSSGTYTCLVKDANNCTKTQFFTITQSTLSTIDNTTNLVAGTLSSNQYNATYQWINCGTGNSNVSGATTQTFAPVINGSYAVIINYNGCTATSSCTTISNVGIEEYQLANQVPVSPNPSTSQFNFSGLVGENNIHITDITGRVLFTEKTFTENHTIKLDAAQGIYFYKITDKQNRVQQGKLLVQ
jgi:hypothetical protein